MNKDGKTYRLALQRDNLEHLDHQMGVGCYIANEFFDKMSDDTKTCDKQMRD